MQININLSLKDFMIGVYLIVVVVYAGPEKLSRKLDAEMPFIKFREEYN